MVYALAVVAAGSFLLLILGIFPGVLADLSFLAMLTSCLWIPALGIGGVYFLVHPGKRQGKRAKPVDGPLDDFAGLVDPHALHRRWMGLASAILILNLVLFLTGVPRRLAFAISRPAFESQLGRAARAGQRGVSLDRQLGLYHVDRIAADPRGGVYFRTYSGADGIGPDTMSYGFAFRPNREGTPFGRAGYSHSRLFGDWYDFEASNDY